MGKTIQTLLFTLILTMHPRFSQTCKSVSEGKLLLRAVTNNGTRSIRSSETIHIGNSNSKTYNQGGNTHEGSSSNQESSVGANAGFEYFVKVGVQASMSSTLGKSRSTGFDWSNANSNMFTKDTTQTVDTECPAKTKCTVSQIVGYCDALEIKTPHLVFDNENIADRIEEPNQVADIRIENNPGEIWVLAKNLTFRSRNGRWERTETCPGGSRVHGFKIKSQRLIGMTGFSLHCAKLEGQEQLVNITEIQSGEGGTGSWYAPFQSYFRRTYATGFAFQTWEDTTGKQYKGNWKLLKEGESTRMFLPDWATAVKRYEVLCPRAHEICGIQTMLSEDGVTISDIGLKCCYHCDPMEKLVVRESYTNDGIKPISLTYRYSIGKSRSQGSRYGHHGLQGSSVTTSGVEFSGIRAGFEASFGNHSSSGFDWGSTRDEMWSSHVDTDIRWSCPGFYSCSLKQLVGFCGTEEVVDTPHKVVEVRKLPGYAQRINDYGSSITDYDYNYN